MLIHFLLLLQNARKQINDKIRSFFLAVSFVAGSGGLDIWIRSFHLFITWRIECQETEESSILGLSSFFLKKNIKPSIWPCLTLITSQRGSFFQYYQHTNLWIKFLTSELLGDTFKFYQSDIDILVHPQEDKSWKKRPLEHVAVAAAGARGGSVQAVTCWPEKDVTRGSQSGCPKHSSKSVGQMLRSNDIWRFY